MADEGTWITVNGRHVFIGGGETPSEAINRSIAQKNEETKERQIANRKAEADKLNGKNNDKDDNQPKFSQGSGKTYKLGRIEQKTLEQGNDYAFAQELIKAYPDECKKEGFTDDKVYDNSYKSVIEHNGEGSKIIYTFWGKDGKKYFFNSRMKITGGKS